MRTSSAVLFLAMLASGPAAVSALAQAPPPQLPQTYSLTMTNPIGAGTTMKVARDGTKESVEQTMPPSANGPGMHIRLLYDFAARKLWTMNLDGGPCSVVTYTSPAVPSMFDPISGSEEMRAGLAQYKPAVLRSETINGIASKVYEMPFPDIKGKMRIFLEEKHNFAVKEVYVWGDGREQTAMEMTALSFAKPAADLFVPPQNCQAVAGETDAAGGHVEMGVEAATPAARQNAAAPKPAQTPPAARPSTAGAAGRGQAAQSDAQVTEVRAVSAQPSNYQGRSPAAFEFTFSITASGATEIKYILLNQADIVWESGTVTFDAAGTKEVKIPVKVGVPNGTQWEGSAKLQVYAPNKIESEPVKISADCRVK